MSTQLTGHAGGLTIAASLVLIGYVHLRAWARKDELWKTKAIIGAHGSSLWRSSSLWHYGRVMDAVVEIKN